MGALLEWHFQDATEDKPCLSSSLHTKNFRQNDPGLRSDMTVTNSLRHCTAFKEEILPGLYLKV